MQKKTKCWIRLSVDTGMLDELEKLLEFYKAIFKLIILKYQIMIHFEPKNTLFEF